MYEDIPLIGLNIRVLKFYSLIYKYDWRSYACLFMSTSLVFTQFNYVFNTDEGLSAIIMNSYIIVLWINTIVRASELLRNRDKYQKLIADMVGFYKGLLNSEDAYERELVDQVNRQGAMMARGNLFLGLLTCTGFVFYPLLSSERALPFGSMIPGVTYTQSPFYEIWYTYEVVITPMGCCMYIPYTSLIVAFIMFGIVMCKCLQHRLRTLHRKHLHHDPEAIQRQLIACIKYQKRILSYIATVNRLTTYVFLLEFIAFGTLLCALFFLLIIVDSTGQVIAVCAYIAMIFAQILALYWYANELREQNMAVAAAAYEMDWFTFKTPVQKQIILLILRAQKPNTIMVGNIYPMSLELFQSLLNASYSYFTLLKRVYAK